MLGIIMNINLDGWKNTDPRLILAMAAGGVADIALMSLYILYCIKQKEKIKRIKQDAIERGQVIKAKLVRSSCRYNNKNRMVCHRTYQYTINGKVRNYNLNFKISGTAPGAELNLYYDKSTGKIYSDYRSAADFLQPVLMGVILLGGAACLLVMKLTGYIG